MNILIISDDPTRESFRQILILKRDIENLTRKKADLVVFSCDGISLNQTSIGRKFRIDATSSVLQNILNSKMYHLCIISLGQKYLERLFSNEMNIIDLIKKSSAKTLIFIFGGVATLKRIEMEKPQDVFFFPRRGVAKITREFKDQILRQIKTIRQ